MSEIELVPICRASLSVNEATTIHNTPAGTMMIGELHQGRFEGERLKGNQRGAAALRAPICPPSSLYST